jgi:putative ABC transport system permease protein
MTARGIWRRFQELVLRRQLDRESLEELEFHVAETVNRKREGGADPATARRATSLELGDVQLTREALADSRTGSLLEQLGRDCTYAFRALAATPGASILSMTTMGVGIGASAILFALVSGVVLQPLPYPEPDRLFRIYDSNAASGTARTGVASGNIDDWRQRTRLFDGIAGYYTMGRTLSGPDGESEVLLTAQVTDDFFHVMGVAPQVGQSFSEDDTRRALFNTAAAPTGPDPVVILSHGVWRQRFGGDAGVIGRSVTLDRRPFRIVGVMPEAFRAPERGVQLWIPWNVSVDRPRDQHYLGAVARLTPGATMAGAEEELNAVARALGDEHPETNRGWSVQLSPLAEDMVGATAQVLWILLAAVGVVLLVACANVALLALLRGLDHAEETAVRLALGATPQRLFRQFLLESSMLAVAGGLLGWALAAIGLTVLPWLSPDLPRLEEVLIDGQVMTFLAAVTVLAALLSGLPAAWRRTRAESLSALMAGGLRSTASAGHHWLRDSIAVVQIAMAVLLLSGSGLLVRSFLQLRASDPGFDPRGVLVAPIFLDTQAYNNGERIRAYYRTLFDRLAALPGVTAVGGATTVPTSPLGPDFERPVWPAGVTDISLRVPAWVRMVTPGYFDALGLTVEEGRPFDDRDRPGGSPVVMVSATLASRLWPAGNAVGQQLVVDYSTVGTFPYEVVGIVGDVRFRGPRSEPLSEIYIPHAQRSYLIMHAVVKSAGDPRALIPAVRSVLRETDPQKPAHGLHALEDLLSATYARDRQAMVTIAVFAATAVFLAVLSVYGVLSQRVRERSREIGIRMALGASHARVTAWLAGIGARLMACGIAIGLAVAWTTSGVLSGLLFGVRPNDPLSAVTAVALVVAVGLTAALVPSWRASRIDPVRVLRKG